MNGPYIIQAQVLLTDGETPVTATIRLPYGEPPTAKSIKAAVSKCEAQMKEALGDEFRLATKREFFDYIVAEELGAGVHVAMPGGEDWDDA